MGNEQTHGKRRKFKFQIMKQNPLKLFGYKRNANDILIIFFYLYDNISIPIPFISKQLPN